MAVEISELKELISARKWYDCAERIKEMVQKKPGDKQLDQLALVLQDALPYMHPISSSETAVVVSSLLPSERCIALLTSTANAIDSQASMTDRYSDELLFVQMHLCLAHIRNGETEETEAQILGWKNAYEKSISEDEHSFSNENYRLLNYISYVFYSRIRNVEEAQKYLHNFITISGDYSHFEEFLKLSIASKSFFDFSSVISLPGFSSADLENAASPSFKGLKALLVDFRDGNFQAIKSKEKQIREILKEAVCKNAVDEYQLSVVEKVFLVNIMNMCFVSDQKAVPFDVLLDNLRVEETHLIALLLKALGIGIVSGWLDSEKRMLFYNGILPRCLSETDIVEMKRQFSAWQNKVRKVIETIESK